MFAEINGIFIRNTSDILNIFEICFHPIDSPLSWNIFRRWERQLGKKRFGKYTQRLHASSSIWRKNRKHTLHKVTMWMWRNCGNRKTCRLCPYTSGVGKINMLFKVFNIAKIFTTSSRFRFCMVIIFTNYLYLPKISAKETGIEISATTKLKLMLICRIIETVFYSSIRVLNKYEKIALVKN